ncbi:hypothetical protein FHETE_2705 [Fusarium heterosporum]|uniref:Uncharacterized protein n=1 Tax=Fusarium heterosporum TaxID=42747 RepID=A0A8H5TTK9_FUSHE|nr:hypothetical protein FHETE_2705 [Fusarium heterosporum]
MKFNQALIASMALILPSVSAWDVRCYSEHDCGGEEGTLVYAPDDDIGMQRFCLNVEGRKSCRFNQGASQSTWTVIGNSVQGQCGGYDHPYGEYPERALVGYASTSLCYAGKFKRDELPWEA